MEHTSTSTHSKLYPDYGNVLNLQVQIHPVKFWQWGDLLREIEKVQVIPDPIGPVIKALDPTVKLIATETQPLSLAQKKRLYQNQNVPVHRFAFQEVQQLLSLAAPNSLASAGTASLIDLGLNVGEVGELVNKLFPTDGDTSFEELRCVGLYPESDLLEAVLTVKQSTGYSGRLCGNGSTEYVAFWIDFNDGNGFQYMGTSTVNVHDLALFREKTSSTRSS